MTIEGLLDNYHKEAGETINLIASENVFSQNVKKAYLSDIMHRYSFDSSNSDFFFPGRDLIDQIEQKTCNLIKDKLEAKYVSIKAISGLNCMMMLLGVFTKLGDMIYTLPINGGGHGATKPIAERLGLKHKFLPYEERNMDLDYNRLGEELQINSPKLIYLDFMNILFNIDLKRLRECVPKNTLIAYDASHVMGLIMGGSFQNPLKEGIDFILGSTHKTLPGPHKGIIATNKLLLYKKLQMFESLYVSHHHTGDVAALGMVLEEYYDKFQLYTEQILKNMRCFSKKLQEQIPVILFEERGFSDTHQLWLDFGNDEGAFEAVRLLAEHKIIVNAMKLPTLKERYGVRLGFQEVTAIGYREEQMRELADLIVKIVLQKDSFESIQKCKIQLMENLKERIRNEQNIS